MKEDIEQKLTPNTTLLTGPLYVICTLMVEDNAIMLGKSTASTSPTSRFFCTTGKGKTGNGYRII